MSYSDHERQTLIHTAKNSIQYGLQHHQPVAVNLSEYAESLQQIRASFVTLNIRNQLRGCIGTLEAHRPLVIDISNNAYASAFSDPRFPRLSSSEFNDITIHISILSQSEPIHFTSEQDLINQIRVGIDGLILSDMGRRGTFLPSVWESLATKEKFLSHLKLKAGLPINYWSDTMKVERYTTESFS